MKILITLGRNVDRKGAPPKIIFISNFNFELWHLCKSLLPSMKGQCIYFYVIYFHVIYFSCWVNFLFQPQSISWQASCGGERSKHIYPVKYIWSWFIIVDNYLYDKYVGRQNFKPLSFSVFNGCCLFLKYALSISNHKRLYDNWVCGALTRLDDALKFFGDQEHRLLSFNRMHCLNHDMRIDCYSIMMIFMRKSCWLWC